MGPQSYMAGRDFGDFVLWRRDDVPAYQLACVVDDAAMRITEVVRGADLLKSTARQILLYRALGLVAAPMAPLPADARCAGQRLAKRTDALSLRALRERGLTPGGSAGDVADRTDSDAARLTILRDDGVITESAYSEG